jgi:pimeloyl-ACP methyl ester carboxylesterase
MTIFLDMRLAPVGGGLATRVSIIQHNGNSSQSLSLSDLLPILRGRHVLIATHGFNVDRAAAIACLSNWESLLQLPPSAVYVGLLWPGDSIWAHGLDYPEEPRIANHAGSLLAPFLDANFKDAASISFVSHSLGARVVLATVSHLSLPVRRVTLMAPAIDNDCLAAEFKATAAKIETISVLASMKDQVLSEAYPLGNFCAGIIAEGHPWWRAALGHCGPSKPWPANFRAPYEIPDNWNFEHGNYLQMDKQNAPRLAIPTEVPPNGSPIPELDSTGKPITGWQEAFSSAFASSRFL